MVLTGTAGWAIPRAVAGRFPGSDAYLARYARVLPCAEINSSSRQHHQPSTYARWAAAMPPGFRFSAKLPAEITHVRRLADVVQPLERFLGEVTELGDRLGPLLVQLPGSLALDLRTANTFFAVLRRRFHGAVVCEPRHASWFEKPADALYLRHRIGRVAADPARVPAAAASGGWLGDATQRGVAYVRWHGAPRIYWSDYPPERLAQWAAEVAAWSARCECWCIFDNTASGAAAPNALDFQELLAGATA